MSKLTSLYHAHLKEKGDIMSNYINGTSSLQKLNELLQQKLNAKDYSEVEELLNAAISETEEQGFKDGCKYTYGLGLELAGQEEE